MLYGCRPGLVSVPEDMQRQAINNGRECYSSSWLVTLATEITLALQRIGWSLSRPAPLACVEPLIMIHVPQQWNFLPVALLQTARRG